MKKKRLNMAEPAWTAFCVVSGRALYDAVSGGLGSTGAAYWRRKTGGANLYCNGG